MGVEVEVIKGTVVSEIENLPVNDDWQNNDFKKAKLHNFQTFLFAYKSFESNFEGYFLKYGLRFRLISRSYLLLLRILEFGICLLLLNLIRRVFGALNTPIDE